MNKEAQQGQILVLALVIVALVAVNTILIIGGSMLFSSNSTHNLQAAQAVNLAEAGLDKALTSLNSSGGAYSGESETALGNGSFSVTVTTVDSNTKSIEATGYIPSKTNYKVQRTIKVSIAKGIGASFKYGVQVGEGGLQMGTNNKVVGSVYSNGNVTSVNNNEVTGDIWVAGGTQPAPDQSTDCQDINCDDFAFGTNVAGNDRADVTQSFQTATNSTLNKVSLKLKKTGNPSDVFIKILADSGGSPDKNSVLTTGTLYSSLVTTNYGWVDVSLNDSVALTANTPYWIVVDASVNSSNYWVWQEDKVSSYTGGQAKWATDWKAGNVTWSNINADLSFKTYVGGSPTYIDGSNSLTIGGNAHANTIKATTIISDAYYQNLINSTAARYYPGSADPLPKNFPISDGNIAQWKQQAQEAAVTTGDIDSCQSVLGPGKYVGNVEFDSRCHVSVKSPVWITGNFELENNNILTLSPEFGDSSGVIIVDGKTELKNGNVLQGTGSASSILMLLSTYDSRSNGISAIVISNTGNSSFLYADKGIIEPGNGNTFKELTAWGIKIFNVSTVNYETGLASAFFSSGPSGSYALVKGTYQLK